jgi:hypothetical protein
MSSTHTQNQEAILAIVVEQTQHTLDGVVAQKIALDTIAMLGQAVGQQAANVI